MINIVSSGNFEIGMEITVNTFLSSGKITETYYQKINSEILEFLFLPKILLMVYKFR